MNYRITVSDRKKVVERMEQLTGEKPAYTKVPRCAYVSHGLVVEKDNTVTLEEDADTELLNKLIEAGLIEPEEVSDEADSDIEDSDEECDDDATSTEQIDPQEEEEPEENAELVKPEISFPLSQHRAESVCNLVFTIFSRGKLLTKSTGGDFYASDELVEELEREMLRTVDKVVAKIHDMGEDALHGLSFQDGKVVFDGFPGTDDPLTVKAWTALSAAINRAAIKQIHVRPKEVDDTNEKYSFRTWLTRLNMNGSELKAERNIFYKNLSGHTAFRTPADEEKWKARQKAKREAAKAERTEEDYGAEY